MLALRDYAVERLASMTPCKDLDDFIRTWLFAPQEQLYGSTPRDVIWREQLGEGNPIPKEYAVEAYGACDCPICQMLRDEIENAESDEAHGHCWTIAPTRACSIATTPKAAKNAGTRN